MFRLFLLCAFALSFLPLAEAIQPQRVVATGGRIGYSFYPKDPGAAFNFRHRTPHVLGGPVTEIQIGFMDWIYTDKVEAPNAASDVTITHAWLERASTGQIVPLTFSGARQLILPMNSTTPIWFADVIPSSVWTGSAPARDDLFWVHTRGFVPELGRVPVGTPATFANARFVVFPPADDPGTFDTAGPVPAIASASPRTEGLPLVFLGRYTGPGHLAVIGIGDSILNGSGDSVSNPPSIAGYGFFNRAAVDSNGKNTIATFNLTRHGQTAGAWIRPTSQFRQTPFLQYANVVVEEYGTNDLSQNGTGDPATILGRLETIWTTVRAAGVQKIVRTALMPRTASPEPDFWSTLAGQIPNSGWEAGGKRDTINAGLASALAAGKIDILLDTLSVLGDPTDNSRWRVNGTPRYVTTDGTHVGPEGNRLLGIPLRAALLSLTVDDYDAWSARISWNGGDASPTADPDGDGHANLLEYALDTDPTSTVSNPSSPDSDPKVRVTNIAGSLTLTFTPSAIVGVSFAVQASSDLVTWSATPVPAAALVAGQPYTFRDNVSLAEAPRRFLRLAVTR